MKKDAGSGINQSEPKKRLFIAIDIPGDIKKKIWSFSNDVLGSEKYIRLVPASNIHVTLKFLGNIDIKRDEEIKEAIEAAAGRFKKFDYEISGKINAFPEPENSRVLFLEINMGSDMISKIYYKLEDNLSSIGLDKERRKFSPHITIARVKSKKNLRQLINESGDFLPEMLECSELTLFESKLSPSGARYIIIDSYSLR
jgi:RNA 2',3'-cyclic 3'-phosphodiesterase